MEADDRFGIRGDHHVQVFRYRHADRVEAASEKMNEEGVAATLTAIAVPQKFVAIASPGGMSGATVTTRSSQDLAGRKEA